MKTDKVNEKHFSYQDVFQPIPSTITSNQPPAWFRALQIGSGIISLILSVLLIVTQYPVLAVNTIITLLSITLLTIGVERVVTGIMLLILYTHLYQQQQSPPVGAKKPPLLRI
jgi:uncharacterized membrane protein HdeD (DUF308 family)